MNKRDAVRQEFLNEIKRFEDHILYLKAKSKRLSIYRLALFFFSLISFFIFFFSGNSIAVYSILFGFFALFGILTGIQNNLDRCIQKNVLWTKIKKQHISRMNLKWNELHPSVFQADDKHPFEADLSITGEFSLHRVMNTASSFKGSEILRDWLTTYEPDDKIISARQQIVKELIPMKRFRDKLLLHSSLVSKKDISGTRLREWIESPSHPGKIARVLSVLSVIIVLNVVLFVLWLTGILPSYFALTTGAYFTIYWLNIKYTKGIFDDLMEIKDDFGKLNIIFDFLETYNYSKESKLKAFCSPFLENSPSKDFKKIQNIINAVGMTRNPLVGLILNIIFPYNLFFAYRLEKIKEEIKNCLPVWMDKWYNLEAYNSLATYAFLNPECSFPEINSAQEILIDAERISHPLIPYDNNVSNDFTITRKGEISIITGSNMSGKSTFLKTIGINLAMAYAGGVVKAGSLRTSLFRIYCCINISDSVTDGISYFYAEVKRLKILLGELNKTDNNPVLFLIDEIFKGTNNMERLQGSRSYIKNASLLNGAGLVSTHDIELSRLENELPSVKNKHFREEVAEGRMIFDYKIHDGPSPTTNALKIMKNEGLPVD